MARYRVCVVEWCAIVTVLPLLVAPSAGMTVQCGRMHECGVLLCRPTSLVFNVPITSFHVPPLCCYCTLVFVCPSVRPSIHGHSPAVTPCIALVVICYISPPPPSHSMSTLLPSVSLLSPVMEMSRRLLSHFFFKGVGTIARPLTATTLRNGGRLHRRCYLVDATQLMRSSLLSRVQ